MTRIGVDPPGYNKIAAKAATVWRAMYSTANAVSYVNATGKDRRISGARSV